MNSNIYLIGMMGVGKSTLGPLLAKYLGYLFLDSDAVIEAQTGKTVMELFEEVGELYFRGLEAEFLTHGHPDQGCVIACGGGCVTIPGMMDALKQKGSVICLTASIDVIWNRLQKNNTRPLLAQVDKKACLEDLVNKRAIYYQQAHYVVDTIDDGPEKVLKKVLKLLFHS